MSENIEKITVQAKNADEAILKASGTLNAKPSELNAVQISEVKTGFLAKLFGARQLFNFEVTKINNSALNSDSKSEVKNELKEVKAEAEVKEVKNETKAQKTFKAPKAPEVKELRNEPESEIIDAPEQELKESKPDSIPAAKVNHDKLISRAVDFTNNVFKFMDLDVEAVPAEKNFIEIIGADAQDYIIGRYADALKSLEYILNLTLRDPKNEPRIKLDSCGYRERRTKSLTRLAEATARQVIKFGRPMRLEPMTSWERWVIHTTLKDRKDVTTESIGEPPSRKVVVTPKYDETNYKSRKYRPSRRFNKK